MKGVNSLELDLNGIDTTRNEYLAISKTKKLLFVFLIIIIIVLIIAFILFIFVLKKDKVNPVKYEYSVMLDAGSTSTKVYTYSYPRRTNHSLLNIEEKSYYKKNGGIDESTELLPYFKDIINNTKENIMNISNSKANLSEVPLFLKATAGLRKLGNSTQEKIISEIQKIIKEESTFLFEDKWAKVITGIEEAYYGWVTVNYITGTLKKNDVAKKQIEPTRGSLDMGGASIEIAFVPNGKDIKENKINLNLGHLSYDLYSNVIEGFGQNEAVAKLNDFIIGDKTDTIIKNPCYLKGYTEQYTKDETKQLVGIGDVDLCEEIVMKLFIPTIKDSNPYFPELSDIKFVALNGFFFIAKSLGITANEYISPNYFLEKGKEYCDKSIEEAQAANPNVDISFIKVYCFMALFEYHLFVDVFKFKPDGKNILFTSKINGYTPSWALGAMTYEVGLLPFK